MIARWDAAITTKHFFLLFFVCFLFFWYNETYFLRFAIYFIFNFNSESFDLNTKHLSVFYCNRKPLTTRTEAKKSPQTLGLASSAKLVSAAFSKSKHGSIVENVFPVVIPADIWRFVSFRTRSTRGRTEAKQKCAQSVWCKLLRGEGSRDYLSNR